MVSSTTAVLMKHEALEDADGQTTDPKGIDQQVMARGDGAVGNGIPIKV